MCWVSLVSVRSVDSLWDFQLIFRTRFSYASVQPNLRANVAGYIHFRTRFSYASVQPNLRANVAGYIHPSSIIKVKGDSISSRGR